MTRTGTSVYPGAIDSFARVGTTNYEDEVGYEIVNVENEAMDALEKIQTTLGTTSETNFIAGIQSDVNDIAISVKNYGATGNGTTDDTTAIQSCIDAVNALGGGEVYFPKGTYKVSRVAAAPYYQSLVTYENISFRGIPRNSIIDMSSSTTPNYGILALGTEETAVLLTADATKADLTLTFDTTGIVVGDYLQLYSDKEVTDNPNAQGEIVRVVTVDSGTQVTLYAPICDTYLTSDNTSIKKLNLVSNINFDGLDFWGTDDTGVLIGGINLQLCKDITINNCTFNKTQYFGIGVNNSIYGKITNCQFNDIEYTGLAYGVMLLHSSQDWIVNHNNGRKVKHFFTTGNAGLPGIVRRIDVIGNNFTETGGAIDSHANGEYLNFSNNVLQASISCRGINVVITGNTIYAPASDYGIGCGLENILPGNIVITNNIIHGSTLAGIGITSSDSITPALQGLIISGNSIDGGDQYGIFLSRETSFPYTRKNVVISNNSIKNCVSHGIQVAQVDNCAITGNTIELMTDGKIGIFLRYENLTNINIENNTITSSAATQTDANGYGIALFSASTDVQVIGNRITKIHTGFYQSDDSDYTIIMGNNTRGCTHSLVVGSGTGHIYQTAASDQYNQL